MPGGLWASWELHGSVGVCRPCQYKRRVSRYMLKPRGLKSLDQCQKPHSCCHLLRLRRLRPILALAYPQYPVSVNHVSPVPIGWDAFFPFQLRFRKAQSYRNIKKNTFHVVVDSPNARTGPGSSHCWPSVAFQCELSWELDLNGYWNLCQIS